MCPELAGPHFSVPVTHHADADGDVSPRRREASKSVGQKSQKAFSAMDLRFALPDMLACNCVKVLKGSGEFVEGATKDLPEYGRDFRIGPSS